MISPSLPARANAWLRRHWPLLAALAAALGPALWYGPLLPLLDSIAFAALHSYPPLESYGPAHYYVFAYTYLLPHLVGRTLHDFGCSVPTQVLLYYAAQAVIYLTALWSLLTRLIPNREVQILALFAGALSFWDGLFLWGGPLAYSWAGLLWLLAAWVTFDDAGPASSPARPGLFLFLTLTALVSHPLAVPFILPLAVLRLVFVRSRRLASAGALAALLLFCVLMVRDNPEAGSGVSLTALFGLSFANVVSNLRGQFTHDAEYIHALFGILPLPLHLTMILYAFVRAAGFLASPWLLWRHRSSRALAFALTLNTLVFLQYVLALPNEWVNQWPKRILTFAGGWSFAIGVYALWLLPRALPPLRGRRFTLGPVPLRRAAGLALLALLVAVQLPILSLSAVLRENLQSLRGSLRAARIDGDVLRFDSREIAEVNPPYLRALPMMLFSDPSIVTRGAMVHTEWHGFGRHNSRLAADYPYIPRPQKQIRFSMASGHLLARLPEGDPASGPHLRVRFGSSLPQKAPGAPVFVTGTVGDANFLYAVSPSAATLRFGLDRWGQTGILGPDVAYDPGRLYDLRIAYDDHTLLVRLDGREVFRAQVPLRSLQSPRYGENPLGGTSAVQRFPGSLEPL